MAQSCGLSRMGLLGLVDRFKSTFFRGKLPSFLSLHMARISAGSWQLWLWWLSRTPSSSREHCRSTIQVTVNKNIKIIIGLLNQTCVFSDAWKMCVLKIITAVLMLIHMISMSTKSCETSCRVLAWAMRFFAKFVEYCQRSNSYLKFANLFDLIAKQRTLK